MVFEGAWCRMLISIRIFQIYICHDLKSFISGSQPPTAHTELTTMADLKKVFQQFANTAVEGEAAVMDKKKVKRALKVSAMSHIHKEGLNCASKFLTMPWDWAHWDNLNTNNPTNGVTVKSYWWACIQGRVRAFAERVWPFFVDSRWVRGKKSSSITSIV